MSPDEYDVSLNTYQAALEFYAYSFDFEKRLSFQFMSFTNNLISKQQSILPTFGSVENDYDGSSLSEDSEGFLDGIVVD